MQMAKKLRSNIAKIYMYNLFVWWHQKGRVEVIGGGGEDKRFKGRESTCYKKPLTLNHAHYFPTNLITSTVNYTIVQD